MSPCQGKIITLPPVKVGQAKRKLIDHLASHVPQTHSKRRLKALIEQNGCLVNGAVEIKAGYLLKVGDHVAYFPSRFDELISLPRRVEEERILYEDEALFVYDKPAGLSTAPELLSLLHTYDPSLRLGHRLDRLSTGLLVFAKTAKAEKGLHQAFRQRRVQKSYLAVLDGSLKKERGAVDVPLACLSKRGGQIFWGTVKEGSRGETAYTEWEVVSRGEQASLVLCRPRTGRTHQIRLHMRELGHPLLGDSQYVRHFKSSYIPARFFLHAYQLGLQHPISGKQMMWTAAPPEDFREVANLLKLELP